MSLRPKIRLFVKESLAQGGQVMLGGNPAHYLAHVMRAQAGERVALFNGADGEWSAVIDHVRKKEVGVTIESQLRAHHTCPDIWLCFTPLKAGRIDYVVEKASELGVRVLQPIFTARTVAERVNVDRLRTHAIEAAEQCERLDVPEVREAVAFEKLLAHWPQERTLIYGDETGQGLQAKQLLPTLPAGAYALCIGPEGGFTPQEFATLRTKDFAKAISLGPRVLRADTAAIAGLTLLQEFLGDWAGKPTFGAQQ